MNRDIDLRTEQPGRLVFDREGVVLAEYVHSPTDVQLESPRPFLSPLRTLGGELVSLFRPHDHVWHKGISWSLPVVGDENFWGGPTFVAGRGYMQLANNGTQQHRGFREQQGSGTHGNGEPTRVREDLDWVTEAGVNLFTEEREFTLEVIDARSWVLVFTTAMRNVSDATISIGSPTTRGRENAGYGGLFWRGPRSFTGGVLHSPAGSGGEELRGTREPWMGFSGQHDGTGNWSTIVMVDDPANTGSPTKWFARTEQFACLCPAPFFSAEVPVAPGEVLRLRYAVVIADGNSDHVDAGRLAELGLAALNRHAADPDRPRHPRTPVALPHSSAVSKAVESCTMTHARSPLTVAIVGTGSIAALHAQAIVNYPDAELVAAVDISAERAAEFAGQWGIPTTYASIDDLLSAGPVDVVHVCTPPGLHAEQAIRALDAGAHVVVEKPPALSLAQLDSMTDAAARNDRELAVVFQQRSGTAAAHVRALLTSGALGRPLVATCQTLWYRDPAYFEVPWRGTWATEGGGPTLGHGIHQIDLLAWLLGDWASVQGQLWRLGRDVQTEDVSTAVLTFANGTVASVITSLLSPREVSSIRIDTEKATITVDHLYGHGHDHWAITPAPDIDAAEAASWALPEFEEASGHDVLLRDIYDALRAGEPLPSTAGTPARAFEIATALYSSAATGRVVTPGTLRDDAARCASLESPVTDLRSVGA